MSTKKNIADATTVEEIVKIVGSLPVTAQRGYHGSPRRPDGSDTVYQDGSATDPKDPKAQEAAYHAQFLGKTHEMAAALGFLAPRPFRKAANAWADANGLTRRVVRSPKGEAVEA